MSAEISSPHSVKELDGTKVKDGAIRSKIFKEKFETFDII
jgi:hypothetical protein